MFRFDCTFSNFNCTKRVQLHTILRPEAWQKMKVRMFFLGVLWLCNSQTFISRNIPRPTWGAAEGETVKLVCLTQNSQVTLGYNNVQTFTIVASLIITGCRCYMLRHAHFRADTHCRVLPPYEYIPTKTDAILIIHSVPVTLTLT